MLLRYFFVTQTKLFQTFNIGTNIRANPFKDKKFYSGIVVTFDSGRGEFLIVNYYQFGES